MRWLPQEWNRKLVAVEVIPLVGACSNRSVCVRQVARLGVKQLPQNRKLLAVLQLRLRWRDMRHTRCKGAWPQEWNRKCVAVEVAPSSPLVGA